MDAMTELPDFHQIRIENTDHCGHRCFFCPREKLTRPMGTMSVADFRLLLGRLSEAIPHYDREVHLHGYGEPLLDRSLPEKIRLTREVWPASGPWLTTTLGVRVSEEYLRALIANGLRYLRVSVYGSTRESYRAIHGVDMHDVTLRNYDTILRLAAQERTDLEIVTKDSFVDIDERVAAATPGAAPGKADGPKILHNFGDGRAYNPPKLTSRTACSVIGGWRAGIMVITWDLKVIPCSFDYDATVVFGDLRRQSLAEVFASPARQAFLDAHRSGCGSGYGICANCDAGPFLSLEAAPASAGPGGD